MIITQENSKINQSVSLEYFYFKQINKKYNKYNNFSFLQVLIHFLSLLLNQTPPFIKHSLISPSHFCRSMDQQEFQRFVALTFRKLVVLRSEVFEEAEVPHLLVAENATFSEDALIIA